jgi:hypothetical protein
MGIKTRGEDLSFSWKKLPSATTNYELSLYKRRNHQKVYLPNIGKVQGNRKCKVQKPIIQLC